jgi:hypothetical protein
VARTSFVIGIWVLAASLSIVGYQVLTYYFYQHWPPVSLATGWQEVVGAWHLVWDMPPNPPDEEGLTWLRRVPLVPVGIILSYGLFLLSDVLRGRLGRRSV